MNKNLFLIVFFVFNFNVESIYSSSRFIELTSIPKFKTEILSNKNNIFNSADKDGQVWVVIIWRSWKIISNERKEHWENLYNGSLKYRKYMHGINYKDNSENAIRHLHKLGNPFIQTLRDKSGNITDSLKVYGIPEILVISKKGKIIYRHINFLRKNDWENLIEPAILSATME